jgi:hypothetical protein
VVAVIACSFGFAGAAGSSDWMIRRGLRRGHVSGVLKDDREMALGFVWGFPANLFAAGNGLGER